jgi:hypothetical protein
MGSRPDARPTSVTILLWGVFIVGALNGWRAASWWQQRQLMAGLDLSATMTFHVLAAFIWMLVCWGLALGLWQRRYYVRWAIPGFLACYALFRLAILLFLAQTPPAPDAWMLPVVVYGVLLGVTSWICWRPANVPYWRSKMMHLRSISSHS